jgi:6-pyruvoyltetrahydropterin/6-carboxytetrahydropterin synthase
MNAKQWMDYMFDHTTIIAPDDPEVELFKEMDKKGIVQLRLLEGPVGAEQFAKFIYGKINTFVQQETNGRVKVVRVEFFENKRNSAIYEG